MLIENENANEKENEKENNVWAEQISFHIFPEHLAALLCSAYAAAALIVFAVVAVRRTLLWGHFDNCYHNLQPPIWRQPSSLCSQAEQEGEQGRRREKERGGEVEQGRQTNATCVEYHLRKMLNTLSENEMERQRKREGEAGGKTSVSRGEGGR